MKMTAECSLLMPNQLPRRSLDSAAVLLGTWPASFPATSLLLEPSACSRPSGRSACCCGQRWVWATRRLEASSCPSLTSVSQRGRRGASASRCLAAAATMWREVLAATARARLCEAADPTGMLRLVGLHCSKLHHEEQGLGSSKNGIRHHMQYTAAALAWGGMREAPGRVLAFAGRTPFSPPCGLALKGSHAGGQTVLRERRGPSLAN